MSSTDFSSWDILDETNQLIQISDLDFNMQYANRPARAFALNTERPIDGEKCYRYMMGLEEQCPFCPLRQMDGQADLLAEVDNGNQVFTVKTKYIEWNGQKAFIEYATDITTVKRAQQIFEMQVHTLLNSIPEAQGVFHLNLTRDLVQNVDGISRNLESFHDIPTVNATIEQMASFIPEVPMQTAFLQRFCRDGLLHAYEHGKTEVYQTLLSYYDDQSIRWTRMTARIIANPTTGDLEAILYGVDISREKQFEEQIATAEQENALLREQNMRDPLTGLYTKAALAETVQQFLDTRQLSPFAVIFLDLDHFKEVNDTFGHLTGDHVLRDCSRTLQRLFDADSFLSRFGGDEFCIFYPNCSYNDLLARLNALLTQLARTIEIEGAAVAITTSIGAVYADTLPPEFLPLLNLSDKALYRSKQEGRNRFTVTKLSEV